MKKYFSIKNISIFIVGCLFILMSIYWLGKDNLMVGGFGVFLLKAISNKDFSIKPFKSILNITIYTLAIGILPSIVNLNIYTGFFINLVSIFLILYMLVYALKSTIYVPFLLGYTFFLCSPTTTHQMNLRIIGLIIVAVCSVIFQIFLYKFQGINLACSNMNKSLALMTELINCKINEANFKETKLKLEKHNLSWNKDILENKQNVFYLNLEENTQLNLIAAIRALKFRIEKFSHKDEFDLLEAKKLIENISNFSKGNYKRYRLVMDFSYFNNKYCKSANLSDDIYEIRESLNIIFTIVINLHNIQKGLIKVSKRSRLRDYITLERNLFRDFRRGSSRFTFSFRTALLISITYFFISLLHIELGKWMLYTIVSISQPYYDVTKSKAFDRLRGTILGGITFVILNIIFRGFYARLIIIFIAIYFVIALIDYSKRIFAATIMSLTIVSISEVHMLIMTWDRFYYVMIGVVIVLIGSSLILPYKLENEIYDLTNVYYDTCTRAIKSLLQIYDDSEKRQEISNLILKANNIEAKILVKNSAYDIKILNEFISDGQIIMDTIHKIINRIDYYDISLQKNKLERISNLNYMKLDIDNIENIEDIDSKNIDKITSKYLKLVNSKGEALIYKDVYDILLASRRLKYLKRKMDTGKA